MSSKLDGLAYFFAPLLPESLQRSRCLVCLDLPPTTAEHVVLLGSPQSSCFHATAVHVRGHGVRLTDLTAQIMDVQPGDPVWVMPLDW